LITPPKLFSAPETTSDETVILSANEKLVDKSISTGVFIVGKYISVTTRLYGIAYTLTISRRLLSTLKSAERTDEYTYGITTVKHTTTDASDGDSARHSKDTIAIVGMSLTAETSGEQRLFIRSYFAPKTAKSEPIIKDIAKPKTALKSVEKYA
jgi:hypothetical protein